ncbi:MAG TPA: DUF2619 domain-containing protein [Firmicutes bacterium]|jgi:hypothetical protein|nr:DUF2619 domain-containing protein [Bacillota bacterium]
MILLVKANTIAALIRLLSGILEVVCAVVIYRSATPKTILKLNAILGALGPVVLLGSLFLGISASRDVTTWRIVVVFFGALLLIIGSFA